MCMLIYEFLSNILNSIYPEKIAVFCFSFPLLWDKCLIIYILNNIHKENSTNHKFTVG